MIERHMLWQQAIQLLGESAKIQPGEPAIVFSPFNFSSLKGATTVRFDVTIDGSPTPTEVSAPLVDCRPKVALRLPLQGRVLVYDGHDVYSHHRRSLYGDDWSKTMGIDDNFQRYAVDLVVTDSKGRLWRGDGSRREDWYGWGHAVVASGNGIIAAFHDGQPDNVKIGSVDMWTDRISAANPMSSYGNYVLIDHGHGEFTLVGHLRNGSVTVKVGERVRAGEKIAETGNSGSSGGVHTHFERRTGWGIAGVHTLPPYVTGVRVLADSSHRQAEALAIDSGDVLASR
jgi:hypothetical protein